MEKFSAYRDASTGIQPFTFPLPPATDPLAWPVRVISNGLAYSLAAVRTAIAVLCLALQFLVVDVLFSPLTIVSPLHRALSRIVNAVLARAILFLLGFVWISVETVSLKRTARSPAPVPFSPGPGDIIVSNSSSFCDLLYLAFRYSPTFLRPVSSTGSKASASSPAKITGWRRTSLLSALLTAGDLPERSERGEILAEAIQNSKGPVVVFPECTTSNNRALLKFGTLLEKIGGKPSPFKVFLLSFKYDIPTPLSPSATLPIKSPFSPLSDIFSLCTSPLQRKLTIRQLHPSESPTVSSSPKASEWDGLAEILAATGRWKRIGLDWEAKEGFLKLRAKRR